MNLKLGFSSCPNDTFMFEALVNKRIDSEGLQFDIHIADIKDLNQSAFKASLDITKISFFAFAQLTDTYQLLHAGSALGNNCGPLLIAKSHLDQSDILNGRIAIPGKNTTANLLFSLAYPEATQKEEMLFSEIEDAVLQEKVDVGLIIHENRFTYQDKGLIRIIDLGEYWETTAQSPIPLGGIVVKKELEDTIKKKINRVLKKSIQFAFEHPDIVLPYVRQYAQEMDEDVMKQHIKLYVNQFSIDLGEKGRTAIHKLFRTALEKGLIKELPGNLFIER